MQMPDLFGELLRRIRLDVTSLSTLMLKLSLYAPGKGRLVTFTLKSGQTSATALHKLSRAYQGGYVTGSATALALVLAPPGADADKSVTLLAATAPGADVVVTAWVF